MLKCPLSRTVFIVFCLLNKFGNLGCWNLPVNLLWNKQKTLDVPDAGGATVSECNRVMETWLQCFIHSYYVWQNDVSAYAFDKHWETVLIDRPDRVMCYKQDSHILSSYNLTLNMSRRENAGKEDGHSPTMQSLGGEMAAADVKLERRGGDSACHDSGRADIHTTAPISSSYHQTPACLPLVPQPHRPGGVFLRLPLPRFITKSLHAVGY